MLSMHYQHFSIYYTKEKTRLGIHSTN